MRRFLSERNFVVILFMLTVLLFSLAQKDSANIERSFRDATNNFSEVNRPSSTENMSEEVSLTPTL